MHTHTIYLAGGCFWGVQRYIDSIPGVTETEVGYANGPRYPVTYEEVKQGCGHAETCKVVYDNALPLGDLLDAFLSVIDPLSVNRQGEDEGVQYRTGIYYVDEADLPIIRGVIDALEAKLGAKTALEVLPLEGFCPAEEYHQKYLRKNPGGYCHIHCLFE
ncbi:MAG: peptide-methionine (S)-S-oxide reductase MsrA [Clostridia bacterium]|nr:peptide-methionine (S)-S-oxide reductase MsrA [Clostridia bacterium]